MLNSREVPANHSQRVKGEIARRSDSGYGVRLQRKAFSVQETAVILGCSEISVRRLINRGLLRANRALRHIRVSAVEIDNFLNR